MIRTISILLVITLSGLFTFQSCKYKDGPSLSLRTKKQRVTGDWTVEKITESDGDIYTSNQNNSIKYTFEKNGEGTNAIKLLGVTTTNPIKWEFTDRKEKFKLTYSNGNISNTKILRLTNKEFWVLTADGDEWKLKAE